MYLLESWFSQGICPVVGLPYHMVILFLVFEDITILFSIVAISIYLPTNCARGFPFIQILSIVIICIFFGNGHSDSCEVIPHYSFDLQFSNSKQQRRQWHPTPVLLLGKSHGWRSLLVCIFSFPFHALEKEMAAHSSVLAWRIPGTGEPGGLPSIGPHRVGLN